jgi:DNA-binding response OmpR family regulator
MKKILIADDESNLRLLVRTTLDEPKYAILVAEDGEDVLKMVQEAPPDLILLDWMMPGKSGIEILEQLKGDPLTAAIPVVMLTAKSQARDRERGMRLGAHAYLVKPFSPLEMMDLVQEILGE